ncbi:MAG: hypothetical protein ACYCSO_03905 [Cuniculiplasma sp.]
MMLLFSESGTLMLDDINRKIFSGRRIIEMNSSAVIHPGDVIVLDGVAYTVMEYNPQFFPLMGERGAQIISGLDSAYIISISGIGHGSRILESGTGSGALTINLLRSTENPSGYVGVDHSEKSSMITKKNVKSFTGMDIEVAISEFDQYEYAGEKLDAIFLDMPEPWRNVTSQRKWLLSGKKVITYLPNYNQVEKTREEYEKNGFIHLETLEIEGRKLLVRTGATRPKSTGIIHTGFISSYMKVSGSRIRA